MSDLKLANITPSSIKLGGLSVSKIYVGTTLVFPVGNTFINAVPSSFSVSGFGETVTSVITSDYTGMTYSTNRAWIVVNSAPSSGNGNLSIFVGENTSGITRGGFVYIYSGGSEIKRITINQAISATYPLTKTWAANQYGLGVIQTQLIDVDDQEWTVTSCPSWISYNVTHLGSGSILGSPYPAVSNLNIYPNSENTGSQRSGYVVLSNGESIPVIQYGTSDVIVTLGGGYLSSSISGFTASYSGGIISYSFTYSGTTYNNYYVSTFVSGSKIDEEIKGRIESGTISGTVDVSLSGGTIAVLYFSISPIVE